MRAHPARRLTALAGLLGALLTGCGFPAQGGGPHDQAIAAAASSPSALDGLPAAEVLSTARRAVASAASGQVLLPVPDGDDAAVPVQLTVDRDGDREVWLRTGGTEVTLRVVDGRGWVSGAYPVDGRLVPVPQGTWVRVPRPDDVLAAMGRLSGARAVGSLEVMVSGALGPADQPVALAGRSDTDGVQTVALRLGEADGGRVVHVAAQGTPAPVAVVANTGETLLEARWDDPVQVVAPGPGEVVDLAALGVSASGPASGTTSARTSGTTTQPAS